MQANAMSGFGRMGYYTHMTVYPLLAAAYFFGYKPYTAKSEAAAEKAKWDELLKAKPVDPDLFNPFTAVPYHNNIELKYVFSHISMRNYIDKNHLNVDDYIWKSFHDSYDHGNKKKHYYNWTNIWGRKDASRTPYSYFII